MSEEIVVKAKYMLPTNALARELVRVTDKDKHCSVPFERESMSPMEDAVAKALNNMGRNVESTNVKEIKRKLPFGSRKYKVTIV